MEIVQIDIEGYKSIKESISLCFTSGKPIVLTGKNSSGKTNILCALYDICKANHAQGSLPGMPETKTPFSYRIHLRLSREDVQSLLPDAEYREEDCEVVAYSSKGNGEIDRLQSAYVVPLLKRRIQDIRDAAKELQNALAEYEEQLAKIAHEGYEDSPLQHCAIFDEKGKLTNYFLFQSSVSTYIEEIKRKTEKILAADSESEEDVLGFVERYSAYWVARDLPLQFRLEYVAPQIAGFARPYITVDENALRREIDRINEKTKESSDRINANLRHLREVSEIIIDGTDSVYVTDEECKDTYYAFLRQVRRCVGKRVTFMRNENSDTVFQKEDAYYYNRSEERNRLIRELLQLIGEAAGEEDSSNADRNFKITQKDIENLEYHFNRNLPNFESGMIDRVSVADNGNRIWLHEKSGEVVELGETSTGRRWYFSYHLRKNFIHKGDFFLLDEPAATLYPTAQKTVREELEKKAQDGALVVYTTHSPVLIPEDAGCVQFVSMTEKGTKVNSPGLSRKDLESLGGDMGVFGVQELVDMFERSDPTAVTRKCYYALIQTGKKIFEIADGLGMKEDTVKSWGSKGNRFRSISFFHLVRVATLLGKDIKDFLQ